MENIVRLNEYQVEQLTYALEHGRGSIRICTGTDSTGNWIKWDAGFGWTPPFYGLDW